MKLGQQPFHPLLREAIAGLIEKREPLEQIVVHHFTDNRQVLQLEIERRSAVLGITFERKQLNVAT